MDWLLLKKPGDVDGESEGDVRDGSDDVFEYRGDGDIGTASALELEMPVVVEILLLPSEGVAPGVAAVVCGATGGEGANGDEDEAEDTGEGTVLTSPSVPSVDEGEWVPQTATGW